MPLNPNSPQGQLGVRDDLLRQHEVRVFPGVRGRVRQDVLIDKDTIIPAGSSVIIQPLNADAKNETQSFKLTLFTRDEASANKDLPESQRNIILGKSFTTKINNPEKTFWFEEHYERYTQPLFGPDNKPSITDIQQNKISDCFLLCVIQSILNHPDGADFIRGMMKQHNDGTTTVRFFDLDTKQPVYIRVNTSVLCDQEGMLNKHHALWIQVLESAYVEIASRYKKKSAAAYDSENVDASASSVFSGGGRSALAFSFLTGLVEENIIDIPDFLLPPWQISRDEVDLVKPLLAFNFPGRDKALREIWDDKLNTLLEMREGSKDSDDAQLLAYNNYMTYFNFYLAHQQACDEIYQSGKSEFEQLIAMTDLALSSADPCAMEVADFLKLNFNYLTVPVGMETVRGNSVAFSGFYSEQQNQMIKDLEQALEKGQLINVSSRAKFAEDTPGIATFHVYTLLDVEIREEKTVHPVTGIELIRPVKYIKLKNPWGNTGRVYQQIEGTLDFLPTSAHEADVFEVELADFFKYYKNVNISQSVNTLFNYDKQRLQLTASIEQWLPSLSINTDTTLDQLVDFKLHYNEYTARLIQLETQNLERLSPEDLHEIDDIFEQNLSEELEQDKISSLLRNKVFPAFIVAEISSNADRKVRHPLHDLLKLRFLKSQENSVSRDIDILEAKIVQEAQYDFCPEMNKEKIKLDIMITAYSNVCRNELDAFEKKAQILVETLSKDQTSPSLGVDCLKTTFQQLIELQAQFVRISTMNASLSKLGVNIDDQTLSILHQQIESIKVIMEMQPRYNALVNDYQIARVDFLAEIASSAQEGSLSDRDKNHLLTIANDLNLNLTPTAPQKKIAHLLTHIQTSARSKIGQKLEQLIHICEVISLLIKKVIHAVGTLLWGDRFLSKTQYETSASVASKRYFRQPIQDTRASKKEESASTNEVLETTQHYREKMKQHRQSQTSTDASQKEALAPSILKPC